MSFQVVNGGTGDKKTNGQRIVLVSFVMRPLAPPTVAPALVHFAHEEDGLLINAHPVFVGAEQPLHVLFYKHSSP